MYLTSTSKVPENLYTECTGLWKLEMLGINPEVKKKEIDMQWISVKERLPDQYFFVLVYSEMGGTGEPCPMTIARWNSEKWETLCNENENNACACGDLFWSTDTDEITHWMPLPKPPEEDA